MKKWIYIFICIGIGYLLNSCMSKNELMIKLYDEASKTEIQDTSNYEIISFPTKPYPNAIASSVLPQVWFGGGIPEPGRNLDLLKADEKGIFLDSTTSVSNRFMVVLNKEKSIIACYFVKWYRPDRRSNYPRPDDLYGREFFDFTCKDARIGEEERRSYYRNLFYEGDLNLHLDSSREKKYGIRKNYRVVVEDVGIDEKYIAPLYIKGSHPAYMLSGDAEFDDDGKLKNFFNISA